LSIVCQISNNTHDLLGPKIARDLQAPFIPINYKKSHGETIFELISFPGANFVPDKIFLVHEFCLENNADHCQIGTSIDESFMMLLLSVDTLRASIGDTTSITLIAPFLPYGRQDHPAADCAGSAFMFSLKVLRLAGVNHIITFDIHNPKACVESLLPRGLMITNLQPFYDIDLTTFKQKSLVVAPDHGAKDRAKELANKLGAEFFCLSKTRGKDGGATFIDNDLGLIKADKNNTCIIVDDIVDSGTTLLGCAETLAKHGFNRMNAFISHGFFNASFMDKITNSPIEKIFVFNNLNKTHHNKIVNLHTDYLIKKYFCK